MQSLVTKSSIRRLSSLGFALAMVLISKCSGVGQNDDFAHLWPTSSPFQPMTLSFSLIGAKTLPPAEERLMAAVRHFTDLSYVPYVFGGKSIGSPKTCQACAACVTKNQIGPGSKQARMTKCPACRACGIDCSSLVSKIFAKARIPYRFAATNELNTASYDELLSAYDLVAFEPGSESLEPGDLILEKSHIMLVVGVNRAAQTYDAVHASRSDVAVSAGGIKQLKGVAMREVIVKATRILRHRDLIDQSAEVQERSLAQWLRDKSQKLLAINE